MNNLNNIRDYLKVFNNIDKKPEPRFMAQGGRLGYRTGKLVQPGSKLKTSGVIKTKELYDLLAKTGIDLPENASNASRIAKVYGIKRPKEVTVEYSKYNTQKIKNPTQFYIKPTASQLKEIKKQYDINQLKRTEGGPGKEAFEKRKKRAIQLLKSGDYSRADVEKIMLKEFPEVKGMKSTIYNLAKNVKGVPSGTTGETASSVVKVKNDLEKLNKSEVKKLLKSGNKNLESLIKKTSKILNIDDSLATRRIGQLIEAYQGDDSYIKAKDDLLLRRVQPLIKGLGKIEGTRLFGGIGGGLQRMAAEGKVAKDLGKTRAFFSSLRKRIQEALPKSGYETDEIKNIRSSARFATSPYSMFVQGIRSDLNQEKSKTLDKQTSIYEKKLQAAKPENKPKIAEEYNTKAKKFAAEANKNLKPGQLPVRVLEISFDAPNKVVKNKFALDNYGDMFDDIHQKHGYSFKVPADVKTIEEVKPFIEGGRGLRRVAQLIKAGAPRIFGIPAAAYLGYQALESDSVADELKAETGNVTESSMIPKIISENPLTSAAVGTGAALTQKPVRSLLGKTVRTLGTPLAGPAFAAWTASDKMKAGESLTDAVIDPLTGAELAIPTMFKENLAKIAKNPTAQKILGLGKFGTRFLGPIGWGIAGVGAVRDAYKDYQRRKPYIEMRKEQIRKGALAEEQFDENLPMFNAGGRVPFGKGKLAIEGINKGRRAFMKLLAALGIGGATAGTGLIKLGGKAASKKVAVKAGADIVAGTQGMPSWFPALVNKVIKEGDDVTQKLATKDREIVHTKKIDTGSASPDEVTIYRDLDTGDIRVEVDSVSNMGETPIQLDYKAPSVIDEGKMAGKKTDSEFLAVESEPRVTNWDGDIEFDGENLVGNVDDLLSDTTKLKNYAEGKKPTMKDIVTRKRKTDKVQKLHDNTMEQVDYIENKQGGPGAIEDDLREEARISGAKPSEADPEVLLQNFPDEYFWKNKKASGGRVSYFDGGIVSLKKKW